jgi:hypothetical protein
MRALAIGCVGVATWGPSAPMASHAGCNCRGGGGGAVMAAPLQPAPDDIQPDMYGLAAGAGGGAIAAGIARADLTPPPGTLGQTYTRVSRPVPAAKHPRAGLLDVHASGASSVSVQWTNPYKLEDELNGFVDARDNTLWHFEAPQLIPGVPLIYRVEARFGPPEACTVQTKYVRLIMGRIVEVSF